MNQQRFWAFVAAMCAAMAALTFLPDTVSPANVRTVGTALIWIIGWMGYHTK